MFHVDFYVEDKRLGQALLALVGIAYGQPSAVPVVNAAKKNGKMVAASNGHSTLERFAEILPKKGTSINAHDVGEMMKPLGLATTSRGYMLKKAVKSGMLKKHGKGSHMTYVVL